MRLEASFVGPFDRDGFAVVGANITHDFSVQIFDGGKDAAGNEITLDFREPDFDLVEPRRIGRRVMNAHLRMTSQKIADRFGFMRTQVITDDVNDLLWSLTGDEIFQKRDELRTGVAGAGLADYLTAPGIKGCIERERSMAVVFKAVAFGPTGRKRQNRIQAIQRLDGTLFVDTEHCGVERRLEVQADDIGRLLFKLRVGAGHIAAQSMGLDPGASPHPSHPTVL